ncbi:hypothetical protein ACIGNX_08745 [Actinosynnema sp. NPDC053489]|uniref:hypothetical protein n=1 Tax=Actinosynnema sp. NPDC053489 TaxID=3363916 RepID=UPI0037C67872
MSNDDKRRRQDGSTAKLSVADLIARREAETQPIPRITDDPVAARAGDDEDTVRLPAAALAAANLSGRELHVTELLRREGRAGEEERGGGFSVPKLVAMASGGVVLAGTVAFTASSLMTSPDERPLAEVRFDARPAARPTNTLTKDLGAAAAQQQAQQAQVETTTTTPEQTEQAPQTTTQRAPRPVTQQPATTQQQTQAQQQVPTTTNAPAPTTSSPRATTPAPTTTTTPPPPSSSPRPSSTAPSSTTPSSTAPSSTTPSSTTPSTAPSDAGSGLGLDLGGILDPLGGFDFFAPAN